MAVNRPEEVSTNREALGREVLLANGCWRRISSQRFAQVNQNLAQELPPSAMEWIPMQYRFAIALCVVLAMSGVNCQQQVSPEQHLNAGAQLQEQRHLVEAIAEYDEAIRLDPWLDEAYARRGLAYADMGQFQKAIQDFNVAITLNPQGAEAFFLRGSVQYSLGKYQLALDDLSEAIRLNPNDARVYGARGAVYSVLGHHQTPVEDFDEAYNSGALRRAVRDYDQAILHSPQDGAIYAKRAENLTSLGRDTEAARDITRAVQLGLDPVVLGRSIERLKEQRPQVYP